MQRADIFGAQYATRYRKTTNEDSMVKYEKTLEVQYTAGADGENSIFPVGLAGINVRVIQVEREIKPIYNTDWSWNSFSGQLTLLNGVTMASGETLFIIYAIIVIE